MREKCLNIPFKMFTTKIYQQEIPVIKMSILPFIFMKYLQRVCDKLQSDKRFSRVVKNSEPKHLNVHSSLSKGIPERYSDLSTS